MSYLKSIDIDSFLPYLDSDWQNEFIDSDKRQQRGSELIMASFLKSRDYNLESKPSSEGPDFVFTYNGTKVWVEVVTPSFGEGSQADDCIDHVRLRLSSVLKDKARKLKGYISKGIVGVSDVKLISVNGAGLSCAVDGWHDLGSVLLGREPSWGYDDNDGIISFGFKDMPAVRKKKHIDVPMGLFFNGELDDIDGVFYCKYSVDQIFPDRPDFYIFPSLKRSNELVSLFPGIKQIF